MFPFSSPFSTMTQHSNETVLRIRQRQAETAREMADKTLAATYEPSTRDNDYQAATRDAPSLERNIDNLLLVLASSASSSLPTQLLSTCNWTHSSSTHTHTKASSGAIGLLTRMHTQRATGASSRSVSQSASWLVCNLLVSSIVF